MSEPSDVRMGRAVLPSDDVDRSKTFFREQFGWTVLADERLRTGHALPAHGPPSQPGVGVWFLPGAREADGPEAQLVLYTRDLDGIVGSLVESAGRVGERGGDAHARWAHVFDPDGNHLVLVELGEEEYGR